MPHEDTSTSQNAASNANAPGNVIQPTDTPSMDCDVDTSHNAAARAPMDTTNADAPGNATQPSDHPSISYDALSGRTIHAPSPWLEAVASRKSKHRNDKLESTPETPKPTPTKPLIPPPRIPSTHYVTVFRPQKGHRVQDLSNHDISQGLSQASGIQDKQFRALITLQVQPQQNLFVIGTPDPYVADRLAQLTSIPLRTTQMEVTAYMKPPPGTSRGVIHGLPDDITPEKLLDYLDTNRPYLIHARLMGRSKSALLTFNGTRVPYYVKFNCELIRCRPYRRVIQVCKQCGEMGHRLDVCPHPQRQLCTNCDTSDPAADHTCQPQCKLCNAPHITASKDCPKRHLPAAPKRRQDSTTPNSKHSPLDFQEDFPTLHPLQTRRPPPQVSQPDIQPVSWSAKVSHSPSAPSTPHSPPPASPFTFAQVITHIQQKTNEVLQQLSEITKQIQNLAAKPLPPSPPPSIDLERILANMEEKLSQTVKQITESHTAMITPLCEGLQTLTDRQAKLELAFRSISESLHSSHLPKKSKHHPYYD